MTLILNKIFDSGKFPEEWALGVIVILFKEGTKSDLNNYRVITLLSMLGKIVTGIVNNRLWEVVNRFEILTESQAGFRQGYRTTDHLFTLTTLIDHYTTKNKMPLFLCFIDFRKAFDKVDHELLWRKISNHGAGGKFLDITKSMYEKVKSCVRSKNGLNNFFSYTRGVRQGRLLSPLPFSLYLNDLVECLERNGALGVELWDIRLCVMLYADDLIVLAENEYDLKLQMDIVGNYTIKCGMEIHPGKTVVMIFNDPMKRKENDIFIQ